MKKIVLSSLLVSKFLFADVVAPEVLTKNNFETSEYQLFVTNTRNIPITKDLVAKPIFEGKIKEYYVDFGEKSMQRMKVGEDTIKALNLTDQKYLTDSIYFKDMQSLQNIGITAVGSAALISLLAPVFGDDTYIQVTDYYKDDKPVTRLLKYLVSDDGLDTNEIKLVFSTTNDQSYHFRSGGFKTITFSKKENEK
jgi:hypothetical protein